MMKKRIHTFFMLLLAFFMLTGCKDTIYPEGTVSPYIPIYDLKTLYKGEDVRLNQQVLFGSNKITGIVVSDYSEGNMPRGLLIVQDKRRLKRLRGIAIPLGEHAADYLSGDSVSITIDGGVLKRIDGLLQITGVSPAAVSKISSGNVIESNRVPSSSILSDPSVYESTLVSIVKGGFNPLPQEGEVLSGTKTVNDGFDDIPMFTSETASFASAPAAVSANYKGIVFVKQSEGGKLIPEIRLRKKDDIQTLSSKIEITPIVISGYIADVRGGDGNYEYMQFLATKDIDFSKTPFSVVVTNNAGATNPTGFPSLGWATGSLAKSGASRTYKFNLTSGFAAKGSYFYVGGSAKKINGGSSTDISDANWIRAFDYSKVKGDDFGLATSGLFANSGNASGFAVFKGTNVTKESKPVDVIFIGSGGSLLSSGTSPVGYRIANTDFYDEIDPITLKEQPFYTQGSNTINFVYTPADLGYFNKLGGVYNPALGRWVKARTQTTVLLTKASLLNEIEGEGATILK